MSDYEARMTFTEHLAELRTRIVRSAIALVVGFVVCYALSNPLFDVISRPLKPVEQTAGATASAPTETDLPQGRWITLNPIEAILVKLKLAAYCGAILVSPFVIYQLCAFVFPGLKPSEKKAVLIMLIGCGSLAIVGVAVAYFGVFPFVLTFLLQWNPKGVFSEFRMSETISIILKGLVGFAVAFQFPMAVLILVYMDLLTPATLKRYRRVAIVGIAVLSAVLTPPDPLSMIVMMGPLLFLYEGSIWLSYLVVRRKKKAAA